MDAAKFYCQYDMKFGLCTALFFVKLTRAKVTWDKGTSNETFCGSWESKNLGRNINNGSLSCEISGTGKQRLIRDHVIFDLRICGFWLDGAKE